LAVDEGMESLHALKVDGVLKKETDKIKDAVQIMDYDGALEVMRMLQSSISLQSNSARKGQENHDKKK
jgi:hypothetical protein